MATKVQIPGLNRDLTKADMEQSRQLYNSLPSDDVQPAVDQILQQLADIFVKNRAHKLFGVHLIHGHLHIPEKTVLFGCESVPRCRWTKPTKTDSLDLSKLRGHNFILTDKGFHPYEYRSGRQPNMAQVGDNFLPELANFLRTNGLGRVLALEVLDNPLPAATMELVLGDHGTVMMDSASLTGCKPFRQTGWAFADQDGKPRLCQDGKQYHGTAPNVRMLYVC
ncbi:hypothetical protein Purlil1_14086 [Purpureocillium lilacinum]|uniref:Uncharacterized protein n=1 Tax=Purpureocillium lilacinum TaxID=33203 RepID=A0ABR0BCA4_PURLI|nr:hypothetical protein Purlil1_14086 [Purpureocillium lilacinum]